MTPHSQQRIGGWLILLGIVLVLFAVRTAIYLVALASAVRIASSSGIGASGTSGVFYEIAGNTFLLGSAVLLLALFFMRRRVFRRGAIAFFAAFVVFTAGDFLLGLSIPEVAARPTFPWRSTVFVAAGSAIVVWYLITSERVEKYFHTMRFQALRKKEVGWPLGLRPQSGLAIRAATTVNRLLAKAMPKSIAEGAVLV